MSEKRLMASRDHSLENAENANASSVLPAQTQPPMLAAADNGAELQSKDVAATSSLLESGKTAGIRRESLSWATQAPSKMTSRHFLAMK